MKTDFQQALTFVRECCIGFAVFSIAPALAALGLLVG